MSKPSVFALAGESKNFVFSNAAFLKKTILIFFPMILALAFVALLGKNLQWPLFPNILILPYFLVYGCYVLSWHRTCLVNDGNEHIVTPFRFGRGDLVFLGFFVLLSGGLSALLFGVDFLARMYVLSHASTMTDSKAQILFGVSLLVDIVLVYAFIRLSFLLPAQSVGRTLKLRDVMTSSRGMVWRLIGADLIFFALLGVLTMVYSAVALQIVGVAVGESSEISIWQQMVISLLVSAPIQLMILVAFALITTALSKAYRWGMENNNPV